MKVNQSTNLISLFIFGIFLFVWQVFSSNSRLNFLFGSPMAVANKIVENTVSGVLPKAFIITGLESSLGFIIGIISGTIIGFLLWYSPKVAAVSRPYISFFGAVPIFAFAPMIIIWFGIGFSMKVALSAFAVFLVALNQAYEGAKSIDEAEYKLLKTYGATRLQTLQKVVLPSSLSWVLASMRLNVGFAILGAFVGEFISSSDGLGYFMIKAGSLYDIPGVLAGGIYLMLLSLFFSLFVNLVEKNRMKIIKRLS